MKERTYNTLLIGVCLLCWIGGKAAAGAGHSWGLPVALLGYFLGLLIAVRIVAGLLRYASKDGSRLKNRTFSTLVVGAAPLGWYGGALLVAQGAPWGALLAFCGGVLGLLIAVRIVAGLLSQASSGHAPPELDGI